ncbi:fluoride efflux transporter FluC [Gorillibacterium sp. sgz5001074]|uniref:fluoride efflux transporter FluC n=1 Tax=Gorillibacterium sp. sgz5001074 TaxID=3446695 RepID=UPI003F675D6B
MNPVILVAAGGFLGAVARFGVSQFAAARWRTAIPYGTLFVNLTGSFLLGWIWAWGQAEMTLLLGTGFMGAFTTFSTFKTEGLRMWKGKSYKALNIYYAITYTCGICLAYAGYGLGHWWAS